MLQKKPSEIYFTQATIYERFGGGCHKGKLVKEALERVRQGRLSVNDFPNIEVIKKYGKIWSLDNRRLWIFKEAEKKGLCTYVNVQQISGHPYWKKRFTTKNGGNSVEFRKTRAGMTCEFCFQHVITPDELYFHKQIAGHKETCDRCGDKFNCPADLEEHKYESCQSKENVSTTPRMPSSSNVSSDIVYRRRLSGTQQRDQEQQQNTDSLCNILERLDLRRSEQKKKTLSSQEQTHHSANDTRSTSLLSHSRTVPTIGNPVRNKDTSLLGQPREIRRGVLERKKAIKRAEGNENTSSIQEQEQPAGRIRRNSQISLGSYSSPNGMMSVTEYLRKKKNNDLESSSFLNDTQLFRPTRCSYPGRWGEQVGIVSYGREGREEGLYYVGVRKTRTPSQNGLSPSPVNINSTDEVSLSVSEYLRKLRTQRAQMNESLTITR